MFYETLALAVEGAIAEAGKSRVELARPIEIWNLCQDPLSYGQVRSQNCEILRYKGKPTKKWFHVVISRLDSGRYELVTYVL